MICFADDDAEASTLANELNGINVIQVASSGDTKINRVVDSKGLAWERYGVSKSAIYLVRPDQYVAGRWLTSQSTAVISAQQRAVGIA